MTQKQFFEKGYAERKLIFVLNIYDILKQARAGVKVNKRLTRIDAGAPHATDETIKTYQVVDHRAQLTKNMIFKLNPEMNRRQLTVAEQFETEESTLEGNKMLLSKSSRTAQESTHNNSNTHYVPLRGSKNVQAFIPD
jgi:transposase-like protein